jgi:hypothetical protein
VCNIKSWEIERGPGDEASFILQHSVDSSSPYLPRSVAERGCLFFFEYLDWTDITRTPTTTCTCMPHIHLVHVIPLFVLNIPKLRDCRLLRNVRAGYVLYRALVIFFLYLLMAVTF